MTLTFLAASPEKLTAEERAAAMETGMSVWSIGEETGSFLACEAFLLTAQRRCDLLLDNTYDELTPLMEQLQDPCYTVMPITETTETRDFYARIS